MGDACSVCRRPRGLKAVPEMVGETIRPEEWCWKARWEDCKDQVSCSACHELTATWADHADYGNYERLIEEPGCGMAGQNLKPRCYLGDHRNCDGSVIDWRARAEAAEAVVEAALAWDTGRGSKLAFLLQLREYDERKGGGT